MSKTQISEKAPFTTVEIRDWSDFKDRVRPLKDFWAFRGHHESGWPLASSLERYVPPIGEGLKLDRARYLESAELRLLDAFRRRLASEEAPRTNLETLSMMQHYGAPTRLLDWTKSPYVAAYFAFEGETGSFDGDFCAVWAIDLPWCFEQARTRVEQAIGAVDWPAHRFPHGHFDVVANAGCSCVMPCEPFSMNDRLTAQQGMFLFAGNLGESFEDNLLSYGTETMKHYLYRFILPRQLRSEALQDLELMNISRATLFPGLAGFAQSLRYSLSWWFDTKYFSSKLSTQFDRFSWDSKE